MGKRKPSDRSRAARREIVGDLDKDLKSVPRLAGYDDKLKISIDGKTRVQDTIAKLNVRGLIPDQEDNKISKKKGKLSKSVSSRKRRRQVEAQLRAESNLEVLSNKKSKSTSRYKNVKHQRKSTWETVNQDAKGILDYNNNSNTKSSSLKNNNKSTIINIHGTDDMIIEDGEQYEDISDDDDQPIITKSPFDLLEEVDA